MNFRPKKDDAAEVNLTPLIDIVFLLLIFFMVSTTFERNSELSIELPESSAEASDAPPETIEVSIDAEGRFYVGGRRLVNTQIDSLRRALVEARADREAPPVIISADANTPHQAVMTVLDAAQQVGLVRLTFAARLNRDAAE